MGLRFRLRVVVPFLAVSLTALSAAALDAPRYGELRGAYPQIDEAVASMPSGDLHGAFNRISALLHSQPLRSLEAGSSVEVPANSERNLVRAIEQLRDRLGPALEELEGYEQLALLQTTSLVVFEPIQALYSDAAWEFCPEPSQGCSAPPVLSALDRLAQDLIPLILSVQSSYADQTGGDPSYPAVVLYPDDQYNSQSFEDRVDELADLLGLVHGEPIID